MRETRLPSLMIWQRNPSNFSSYCHPSAWGRAAVARSNMGSMNPAGAAGRALRIFWSLSATMVAKITREHRFDKRTGVGHARRPRKHTCTPCRVHSPSLLYRLHRVRSQIPNLALFASLRAYGRTISGPVVVMKHSHSPPDPADGAFLYRRSVTFAPSGSCPQFSALRNPEL